VFAFSAILRKKPLGLESLVARQRSAKAHILAANCVRLHPKRVRTRRPPDEVAAEIVESLETALDRFRNVAKALGEGPT
jgi:hypothetical protein